MSEYVKYDRSNVRRPIAPEDLPTVDDIEKSRGREERPTPHAIQAEIAVCAIESGQAFTTLGEGGRVVYLKLGDGTVDCIQRARHITPGSTVSHGRTIIPAGFDPLGPGEAANLAYQLRDW